MNGRFEKGNEIGSETRFAAGNSLSNKYREEYCAAMLAYFRSEKGFPTFELFADSIGVHAHTLENWRGAHPRFGTVYDHCLSIQRGRLLRDGLAGKYNPTVMKFVAVNCHGMSDKSVNDAHFTYEMLLPPELAEEAN